MTEYTRLMAKHFHGFRIDNCHSTPLHVGAYLLDVARETRPDVYICAELFTGNEDRDILFVSHLGISSLIREAMQAWGPQELSRCVPYLYFDLLPKDWYTVMAVNPLVRWTPEH